MHHPLVVALLSVGALPNVQLSKPVATVDANKIVCRLNGLAFSLTQSYEPSAAKEIADRCRKEDSTPPVAYPDDISADNFNGTVTFVQQRLSTPLVARTALTTGELASRRITRPTGHAACAPGSPIRCVPGPCRVFDYDYTAAHAMDYPGTGDIRFAGSVRCGPVFGVQAIRPADKALSPETVGSNTAHFFPSLTDTSGSVQLYGSRVGDVPVPRFDAINGNPQWYYTTKIAHRYASTAAASLKEKNCAQTQLPPYRLQTNKHAIWTQKEGVATLGRFDEAAAFSRFSAGSYSNFVSNPNSTQAGDFAYTIPQMIPGASADTNVTTDLLEDFGDRCDLSQCDWLPTFEGKGTGGDRSSRKMQARKMSTCFLAEYINVYMAHVNSTCLGTSGESTSCNFVNTMLQMVEKLMPRYCYNYNNASVDNTPFEITCDPKRHPSLYGQYYSASKTKSKDFNVCPGVVGDVLPNVDDTHVCNHKPVSHRLGPYFETPDPDFKSYQENINQKFAAGTLWSKGQNTQCKDSDGKLNLEDSDGKLNLQLLQYNYFKWGDWRLAQTGTTRVVMYQLAKFKLALRRGGIWAAATNEPFETDSFKEEVFNKRGLPGMDTIRADGTNPFLNGITKDSEGARTLPRFSCGNRESASNFLAGNVAESYVPPNVVKCMGPEHGQVVINVQANASRWLRFDASLPAAKCVGRPGGQIGRRDRERDVPNCHVVDCIHASPPSLALATNQARTVKT